MSKPRDVVVVRVSEKGDREDEHFHSPEVQIEAARRWAKDRVADAGVRRARRDDWCSSKPATSSVPIEALAFTRMQQSAWLTAAASRTVPLPAGVAVRAARDLVACPLTRQQSRARRLSLARKPRRGELSL